MRKMIRRNAAKVPANLIGASEVKITRHVKRLSPGYLEKIIKNQASLNKTAAGKNLVQSAIAEVVIRKMNRKYSM